MLSSPLLPRLRPLLCHRLDRSSPASSRVHLSSTIAMNTSQHPYRIHRSTPPSLSVSTIPSPSSSSSSSSSSPPPSSLSIPSHLTVHAAADPSARSFTLMQYNILAGNLATPEHFPFAKPHLLDWTYRRQAIIDKVRTLLSPASTSSSAASAAGSGELPTFLCFQELTDYWTWFEPALCALGYASLYVKRPSLHVSNWSQQYGHTHTHTGRPSKYTHSLDDDCPRTRLHSSARAMSHYSWERARSTGPKLLAWRSHHQQQR